MMKLIEKYSDPNNRLILVTNYLNVWIFEAFGLGIYFTPHWSIYIVIGFVSINIFLERSDKE